MKIFFNCFQLVIGIILLPVISCNIAARERSPWTEKYYADKWCYAFGGEPDVTLPSGREVDCLTPNFAIEADWAAGLKPYEAIGQTLIYSDETNRIPGILLLIKDDKGIKWVDLLRAMFKRKRMNVPVWYLIAHERYK